MSISERRKDEIDDIVGRFSGADDRYALAGILSQMSPVEAAEVIKAEFEPDYIAELRAQLED